MKFKMKNLKKIKIETVEEFLEVKLAKNQIVIGWDVSMRSTGIAVIRTSNDFLVLDILDKIKIPQRVNDKDALDLFIDQLNNFAKKVSQTYKIDVNVIEDCFFGNNVRTLKALARHSALVYDRFRGLTRKQYFILPTKARGLVNFEKSSKEIKGDYLKKEIVNYVNKALGIHLKKNKDQDLGDAIVLALAGLVEE